jgi:hypothetical protein
MRASEIQTAISALRGRGFHLSETFLPEVLAREEVGMDLYDIHYETTKIISGRFKNEEIVNFLKCLVGNYQNVIRFILATGGKVQWASHEIYSRDDKKIKTEFNQNTVKFCITQKWIEDAADLLAIFNPNFLKWVLAAQQEGIATHIPEILALPWGTTLHSSKIDGSRILILVAAFGSYKQTIYVYKDGFPVDVRSELFTRALQKLQLLSGI